MGGLVAWCLVRMHARYAAWRLVHDLHCLGARHTMLSSSRSNASGKELQRMEDRAGCNMRAKSAVKLRVSEGVIGADSGGVEKRHLRFGLEEELVSSWKNLLSNRGLCETVEALDVLVQQGIYVDTSSFYCVLKRCMKQKDLVLGSRIHGLIVKSGYESDAFLGNHIISMYALHGRLVEAVQVFAKVAAPNPYVWSSIIKAHAEHGQPLQAIKLYQQMKENTVKPDNYVIAAVLKACCTAGDLASGKEVHADLGAEVEPHDVFVSNCLVEMYAKCGSVEDARRVFVRLTRKNLVTWNAMIAGCAQHGCLEEALALHGSMLLEDIFPPDRATYVCLVKACISIRALHEGKELHSHIRERGLDTDVIVGSCLVDLYAKCGTLEDAREVFDRLPRKNVVIWNTMMAGYAENGLGQEALTLYANMQKDCTVHPDSVTFLSLLKACASARALHHGKQLHSQIQESGIEVNVFLGSCLVDMYAKCGSLGDARRVFDNLQTRDVVTWNCMISAYAEHGLGPEAFTLYTSMQQEGMAPSVVTLVCLLKACGGVGALKWGKQLHKQIQERGLESDVLIGNCLVDMYAKCGSLEDARKAFDRLPTRDVVTWTALLNGYAEHSNAQMAIWCFEKMRQEGVQPNGATFVSLLVACSHEGLVSEGQLYFNLMVEDCGIVPTVSHYNCMVDLLGRSGCLDEAEKMLRNMPIKDDAVGWRALLSACKSHGDTELARRCFERLVELEPEDARAYVLLANVYAGTGMWAEVARLESLRRSVGARKKPAKASIEVEKVVHEFTVGEERSDVSSKLKSMNSRLEGVHVPQTELVVKSLPEAEKEDALCGHAEKLALAYGLLNTRDGTTLLITKNLRMCDDCHRSTKVVSRLEKREIIVRDAHSVHHFVDGFCSCGLAGRETSRLAT